MRRTTSSKHCRAKLAKYLSRQVYDSIFEGKTDVHVQSYRKELTVFFSDIAGFTDLTDRLEAEVVSDVLNRYLSEMASIADGCGGTIDKFIGDGIMIFFGDPQTRGRQQDAIECVGMALRMKQRTAELNDEWVDLVGPDPLHVRVGVNTGFCTVGNFGSEDRLDYTIVGGAVNAASRLEATAEADQIQISHATYSLIKDYFYCRPIGDIQRQGNQPPTPHIRSRRRVQEPRTRTQDRNRDRRLQGIPRSEQPRLRSDTTSPRSPTHSPRSTRRTRQQRSGLTAHMSLFCCMCGWVWGVLRRLHPVCF